MTLNYLFNDIITNEKSRDLSIEIIVNDKVYLKIVFLTLSHLI